MTRPFQYDNFVQSQIAMGNGYNSTSFPSNPQSRNYLETSNGNQSRLSLKQKINQLLGLCKDQNEGMKNQFKKVIVAEKEILNLMKQQMDQPPRFNNYARSNVQMFPNPSQVVPGVPMQSTQGYEDEQRQRSYQSFPAYRSGTQNQQYPQQQQQYYQQPQHLQHPQGGDYYGSDNAGTASHPHQHQSQHYQNQHPQQQQGSFGFGSGPIPNDRANILKSKVLQLMDENNRLKGLASQHQIPQDDDAEIRQLQQQVIRLRNIVKNYENQLYAMGNNPNLASQKNLLKQLLDQGQRIRQDTIALLRNKTSGTETGVAYGSGNYGSYGVGSGVPAVTGSGYGGYASGNYGAATGNYASGGYAQNQGIPARGNFNQQQYAQMRNQLNELRMECEQLHLQNANIKRVSKGTNFTSGSRRI